MAKEMRKPPPVKPAAAGAKDDPGVNSSAPRQKREKRVLIPLTAEEKAEMEHAREQAHGNRYKGRIHNSNIRDTVIENRLFAIALQYQTGCTSRKAVAAALSITHQQVTNLVNDPRFPVIVQQLRDRFMSHITDIIADEGFDQITRSRALTIRAKTILGEIVEDVRDRMREGKRVVNNRGDIAQVDADAADLRAGTAAAKIILDDDPSRSRDKSVDVQINVFTPDARQAGVIRETYDETGMSMSDVLDADYVIEAEVVHGSDKAGTGAEEGESGTGGGRSRDKHRADKIQNPMHPIGHGVQERHQEDDSRGNEEQVAHGSAQNSMQGAITSDQGITDGEQQASQKLGASEAARSAATGQPSQRTADETEIGARESENSLTREHADKAREHEAEDGTAVELTSPPELITDDEVHHVSTMPDD